MKKRPIIWIFSTLIFTLGLTSCSTTFSGIYGIKKIKPLDEKAIIRNSNKFNIPASDNYELGTSYFSFLISFDTTLYKEQQKNHYQPLQALYYGKTGQLESFQINCYAGGFPNLNWGRNEILTTFPPLEQAPLDSMLSLDSQIKYLKPLSQTNKFSSDNYDYVVIVYWNRFMGRQSKRLIRFVQDNSKLAGDKKVKIIYVNNDNIYLK
ncbi:MAG: hypothetical protein H0X62_01810 [Bacteroidetes bacterium]|nr:hypothetical protein [Bacteroidota bacterium]